MTDKPKTEVRSVLTAAETAAEYLAYVSDVDYECENGSTALYYDLLATVAKHCPKFKVTTGCE